MAGRRNNVNSGHGAGVCSWRGKKIWVEKTTLCNMHQESTEWIVGLMIWKLIETLIHDGEKICADLQVMGAIVVFYTLKKLDQICVSCNQLGQDPRHEEELGTPVCPHGKKVRQWTGVDRDIRYMLSYRKIKIYRTFELLIIPDISCTLLSTFMLYW